MPDTTPTESWATEQFAAAQEAAVRWAGEAEQTALDATSKEDYAKDRAGSDYLRQAIAEARQEAAALRTCSAEASRLAETWARVACALARRPDGQPAAYDLTVQLRPHGQRRGARPPRQATPAHRPRLRDRLTMPTNPRNGRPYRRLCAQQHALLLPCWWCGGPIRYDITAKLAQRHVDAFTLDHAVPLSLGGDLLDPANARSAHRCCNSARGNCTGAAPQPAHSSGKW